MKLPKFFLTVIILMTVMWVLLGCKDQQQPPNNDPVACDGVEDEEDEGE